MRRRLLPSPSLFPSPGQASVCLSVSELAEHSRGAEAGSDPSPGSRVTSEVKIDADREGRRPLKTFQPHLSGHSPVASNDFIVVFLKLEMSTVLAIALSIKRETFLLKNLLLFFLIDVYDSVLWDF